MPAELKIHTVTIWRDVVQLVVMVVMVQQEVMVLLEQKEIQESKE